MATLEIEEKTTSVSPWPVRTEEAWRFGSYKEANFESLAVSTEGVEAEVPFLCEESLRFVFLNHRLLSQPENLPDGLRVELGDGLSEGGSNSHEAARGRLGSKRAAELHAEQNQGGLTVIASAEISQVIEIIHIISGNDALVLPKLFLQADPNAKLRVIERFRSANDGDASVVIAVTDTFAEEGSQLTYLATQELNRASRMTRFVDSDVQRDAVSRTGVVHTGARWVREETYSTVDGTGASSEIVSVGLPDSGQELDQRTFQNHRAANTFSDLLFKNTLFGKSKTVFSGLIFVEEKAHHTDAYQTCRNLMMSDSGEAHSMPGLEINADQVKCSHGSTTARVSDEEIFYLQARGIPAAVARRIIAQGFSEEAIEKLQDEEMSKLATLLVTEKFQRIC